MNNENTATISLELVADEQALAVIKQNALTPDTAKGLTDSFAPLFTEAGRIIGKSRDIVVTDVSQSLEIKLARECRLALRKIRVAGDKVRKELKEDSLRRGKAIDGFYNILLHLTEEEEKRLDEQEKFAERKEQERKAALKAERETALAPYGVDVSFMSLAEMPDATFAQLLENTRAGHEAKLAAERKAEDDRIRAENERIKDELRIREENARLQREAQEREAAARKEREDAAAREKAQREAAEAALKAERARAEEAQRQERLRLQAQAEVERQKQEAARKEAEAKAAAERAAREKLEREAAAREKADKERIAKEREAARKAAAAPDRQKLFAFAKAIKAAPMPKLDGLNSCAVGEQLAARIQELAAWIEKQAEAL